MFKLSWRSLSWQVLLICFLSCCLSFCKKEEIPGPKGEAGAPGIGGNSNIVPSAIFVISSSQWKPNGDTTNWTFKIEALEITAEVAEKGIVKVFIQTGGAWWELPYLEGESLIQFGFSAGTINLSYLSPHGEKIPALPTTNFRYITVSEIARLGNPNVNWNNYEEIMNTINTAN